VEDGDLLEDTTDPEAAEESEEESSERES